MNRPLVAMAVIKLSAVGECGDTVGLRAVDERGINDFASNGIMCLLVRCNVGILVEGELVYIMIVDGDLLELVDYLYQVRDGHLPFLLQVALLVDDRV